MDNLKHRVRAADFFAKNEEGRVNPRWLYPDPEGPLSKFAERLEALGIKVWVLDPGVHYVDTIYLELPEQTPREVIEIVGMMHADECDLKNEMLRLWWD